MGYILFANIISMVIGLFNSFMLPKFLSLDTYAIVKTYNLYITYANLFCFGYNEGMYLRYGGKNIKKINKNDMTSNLTNFIYLEFATFLVLLIASFTIHNYVLGAFSIAMFALNIITYLKSLYQATGEFVQYGRALNYEKIGVFILNIVLMFVLKSDNYYLYIAVQVAVEVIVCIYLLIMLRKSLELPTYFRINFGEIISNIKDGFILMVGNFSSSIFVGMDRWFVKILLTSAHFAYYSFAASIESLINVFITPITISLYNEFCKGIDDKRIKLIKNSIMIWGFAIITVAFPIKWIVMNYLVKYVEALSVIYVLLVAQPFYAVIKGIYVNLYKSNKRQNYYMKQMLIMILIGAVLNGIFYLIYNNMLSIAYATLITAVIWLMVCESKSEYRFTIKEWFSIIIFLVCFLLCGKAKNEIVGMIIYIFVCLTVGVIFQRGTLKYVLNVIIDKVKRLISKFH